MREDGSAMDEHAADCAGDRDRDPAPRSSVASRLPGARFVVHHHLVSSEHYELRLEIDGVLVSWAVPKGPSTTPDERRLAVRIVDRPVDDLDAPSGAGRSNVWDSGTWANTSCVEGDGHPLPAAHALERGCLSFRIDGDRLHGVYTLQRFRDRDEWLLVKRHDADTDVVERRRRALDTV